MSTVSSFRYPPTQRARRPCLSRCNYGCSNWCIASLEAVCQRCSKLCGNTPHHEGCSDNILSVILCILRPRDSDRFGGVPNVVVARRSRLQCRINFRQPFISGIATFMRQEPRPSTCAWAPWIPKERNIAKSRRWIPCPSNRARRWH